jgi:SAM-dependent methyltransferase
MGVIADTGEQRAWEASYGRLENHLFWPHEEVVRFMSRHVRRRIGPSEYVDVLADMGPAPRLLDLGCGIARHVVFAEQMGFEGYGLDHSTTAIAKAREWLAHEHPSAVERVVVGDVRRLPWPSGYFAAAVSHGVLDSMAFDLALRAVDEVRRVLMPSGLFYCDLVHADGHSKSLGEAEETLVEDDFERGTVQSYFDEQRLKKLFAGRLEVVEQTLVTHRSALDGQGSSRWHLVLRRAAAS